VVAGLCVTETVSWGILYYGFPVFLRPMEAELGWSRVEITGAFSVGLASSALAALPVGRWIDRHGARSLMTAGSCAATLLVLAWSRVDSLPALYALWFLMGLALAATLYEPAFAAIVGWFPTQHRDRSLLTVTLGAALLQVAVGGYEGVFGLLAASLVLAGIGVMLSRRAAAIMRD
jgi:MFS family permease